MAGPVAHSGGIARPLFRDLCSGTARDLRGGTSEHQEVVGDDAESDPALHAGLPTGPTPSQPMTSLERADPTFAPGPPSQRPAGEPRTPGRAWQDHVVDTALLARARSGARRTPHRQPPAAARGRTGRCADPAPAPTELDRTGLADTPRSRW